MTTRDRLGRLELETNKSVRKPSCVGHAWLDSHSRLAIGRQIGVIHNLLVDQQYRQIGIGKALINIVKNILHIRMVFGWANRIKMASKAHSFWTPRHFKMRFTGQIQAHAGRNVILPLIPSGEIRTTAGELKSDDLGTV